MGNDNKLAPRSLSGFEPSNLHEAFELSKRLCATGVVPDALRNKPDDTMATLMMGHELGLKPMQALRSIHIVKGRPVLAADLMVALCLRDPNCEEFRLVKSDEKIATYSASRRGQKEPTVLSWTIDMAKRAGLVDKNPTWRSHPEAMLRARCASAIARAVFPDLLMGVYETNEGEEIAARQTEPEPRYETKVEVQVSPQVEVKALPAPSQDELSTELADIRAKVAAAQSEDELKTLVTRIKKLPPPEIEAIKAVYQARKSALTPKAREPGED